MGYDPDRFITPPGEFWTCPKCSLVLHNPVQICDNLHSICSSCSLSTNFYQCPANSCCGKVLEEADRPPDTTASRFLSSQKIRCKNSKALEGTDAICQWVGPLAEENVHAITCTFTAMSCPHPGCTFRAISSAFPAHVRICPYRPIRCPNANISTTGGSPRKGCPYKGSLNAMDQHLVNCTYNPCPQTSYGCLFTNTLALVEQHAPECKDLLFRELCELRKRIAAQQVSKLSTNLSTPHPVHPVTSGDVREETTNTNTQMNHENTAPLLMTPPSTNIPSSELGANEPNPFDATVIPEDVEAGQRSPSILDLDLDVQEVCEEDYPASDEGMEEGEVSSLGGDDELLVDAVSDEEAQPEKSNELVKEDPLPRLEVKGKSEEREREERTIAIARNANRLQTSSPSNTFQRDVKMPNIEDSKPLGTYLGSTANTSAILGYGYMEGGQIFPMSLPHRALARGSSREEPSSQSSRIKVAREIGSEPPLPESRMFGPIRTNMHRRSNAVSYGRGPHPYLPNGAPPRRFVSGSTAGLDTSRHPPAFPFLERKPFMGDSYHFPGATRSLGECPVYPPGIPTQPPYRMPTLHYADGGTVLGPPHGYRPQMRQSFKWEGFEASPACQGAFDARMIPASTRRPFSTHYTKADSVQPQRGMYGGRNFAMEDQQSLPAWHEMHPRPHPWWSYESTGPSFNHGYSLAEGRSNPAGAHPSVSTSTPMERCSVFHPLANPTMDNMTQRKDLDPYHKPAIMPPRDRPPTVSAIPLDSINKVIRPIDDRYDAKSANAKMESFTPSLLFHPPVEYLERVSCEKPPRRVEGVKGNAPDGTGDSDESEPLALKLLGTKKLKSPPKRSQRGIIQSEKTHVRDRALSKMPSLYKGLVGSGNSSPTKGHAKFKPTGKIAPRTESVVQLASSMGHGPPDDGTVRAIHLDISVASKLSGVQFPPNDCVTNENKSRGLKSSKPKPVNVRGGGRGRGRVRGKVGGKVEQSIQNTEVGGSTESSKDEIGYNVQGQADDNEAGNEVLTSGNSASNISFPISHSRTTASGPRNPPDPSTLTPSRLLAAHGVAQNGLSNGSPGWVDFFSPFDSTKGSPIDPTASHSIAPLCTWNSYALTSHMGVDQETGPLTSMDFEPDALGEWTHLADYQDPTNEPFLAGSN